MYLYIILKKEKMSLLTIIIISAIIGILFSIITEIPMIKKRRLLDNAYKRLNESIEKLTNKIKK
jgi:predicted small integral membrane protein